MALRIVATITAEEPRAITLRFHGWTGWVHDIQDRGERVVRIGQAGSIRQITGREGKEDEVRIWMAFSSESDMNTAIADFLALKEHPVAVSAPFNRVLPHVTVNDCWITKATKTKGPAVAGTAQSTHRIEGVLRLEVQPIAADEE